MQGMRSNISLRNSIFAVHIADVISLYAFRAIPLTKSKLGTHCDFLEKVSVQFLPTDTNWIGWALDKTLFILDLGQITV